MDKLTDAEIDECSQAAYKVRSPGDALLAENLPLWRPYVRGEIERPGSWQTDPGEAAAARSRAAAILAARKRERLGPWEKHPFHDGWTQRCIVGTNESRIHLLPDGWFCIWTLENPSGVQGEGDMAAADSAAREFYDLDDAPVVSNGGSGSGGGAIVVNYVALTPTPPAPAGIMSALDRLLTPGILHHQPIALQRAIVDTMQAGREVPSRLLWRMELEREPEAQQLRAEVIAGRIRARGWREARD